MITVLAGGVGAARLLTGMVRVVDPTEIVAVVNTGDDTVLHGLSISPDLDTVVYTVADAIDPERGWGRRGETWRAMEALARFTPYRPEGSVAPGSISVIPTSPPISTAPLAFMKGLRCPR
jgi:LPPG:FO 2-phospho-L-lactate transferase